MANTYSDLTGTNVAANFRNVTTGNNMLGAALKFYAIDFGVDIRQADAANEVTNLTYQLISQLGWTPVIIGTIQSDGSNAGQLLRFAIEQKGAATETVTSPTSDVLRVRTVAVEDPVVKYIDPSQSTTVQQSAVLSTALTDMFDNFSAFAYTNDAGSSATIDLSGAACTVFDF